MIVTLCRRALQAGQTLTLSTGWNLSGDVALGRSISRHSSLFFGWKSVSITNLDKVLVRLRANGSEVLRI